MRRIKNSIICLLFIQIATFSPTAFSNPCLQYLEEKLQEVHRADDDRNSSRMRNRSEPTTISNEQKESFHSSLFQQFFINLREFKIKERIIGLRNEINEFTKVKIFGLEKDGSYKELLPYALSFSLVPLAAFFGDVSQAFITAAGLSVSLLSIDRAVKMMIGGSRGLIRNSLRKAIIPLGSNGGELAFVTLAALTPSILIYDVPAVAFGSNLMNPLFGGILVAGIGSGLFFKNRRVFNRKFLGLRDWARQFKENVDLVSLKEHMLFWGTGLAVSTLAYQTIIRDQITLGNWAPFWGWAGIQLPLVMYYFKKTFLPSSTQVLRNLVNTENKGEDFLDVIDHLIEQNESGSETPNPELTDYLENLHRSSSSFLNARNSSNAVQRGASFLPQVVLRGQIRNLSQKRQDFENMVNRLSDFLKEDFQDSDQNITQQVLRFQQQIKTAVENTSHEILDSLIESFSMQNQLTQRLTPQEKRKKVFLITGGLVLFGAASQILGMSGEHFQLAFSDVPKVALDFIGNGAFTSLPEMWAMKALLQRGFDEDAGIVVSGSNVTNIALGMMGMSLKYALIGFH